MVGVIDFPKERCVRLFDQYISEIVRFRLMVENVDHRDLGVNSVGSDDVAWILVFVIYFN